MSILYLLPKPDDCSFKATNEAGLQIRLGILLIHIVLDLPMILQEFYNGVQKRLQGSAGKVACNHLTCVIFDT